MSALQSIIVAALDVDRATVILLLIIVGAAAWTVRNMVGLLIRLVNGPIALVLSLLVYATFVAFGMFNIKNFAEWMIWTIAAGTAGTGLTLGSVAFLSALTDRSEARIAPR